MNMFSNRNKWMRIFDIPDVSKHKNGFTIYKVISMLYPESCPDAVTKVTVWKRFNDFKKLHREMKVLHRKLNIKTKCPNLPRATLFKRFDDETIQERKQCILNFLEYVGTQSQLYTSNEFVKFFESSHTPVEQLSSNINLIRADLNLPEDPEYASNLATNSDDDQTVSDTDSVTTLSSLSPSVQTYSDLLSDTIHSNAHSKLKKLNSCTSITSKTSDSLSFSESVTLLDGHIYPTPPNTPSSSTTNNDYVQYILDASVHINLATELENDKKWDEAFLAYKTAIDILLKYGKDDANYDRKQVVRYKTEKYLIRAEKIYNMYLAPEVKNIHVMEESPERPIGRRPLFELYKYKVVKIIASGMLVLHCDLQQLFYIKVIHKTVQFLNENLILPENVPYMLKLHNHYNCENALFLVLEYSHGVNLSDYLKLQSSSTSSDEVFQQKDEELLRQLQDLSDNESENSYSDLINDYTSKKNQEGDLTSSDDSFVKVTEADLPGAKQTVQNIMDEPIDKAFRKKLPEAGSSKNLRKPSQRKFSDISSCLDVEEEFDKSVIIPEKDVVRWAAQLLLALEKLHTLGVICRDLEAKNLLIDERGDLVLTYMCNVKDLCDLFTTGVNINLAPEVYSFQAVTAAVDWWSFGAILYELLVGMPLSQVHTNGIKSYTHLKIPRYVSLEGRSLLKQLLSYDPNERLGSGTNGTDNIKSHPFFNALSWDSLSH